jgi:GGDEF domain-containing protein
MPQEQPHRPKGRFTRKLHAVDPAPSEAASSLLELDLITRDLAAKPGVASALIAAASSHGTALVLSCGRPGDRSAPGPRDFVGRAVRAERALSEPLDPAVDACLCPPISGGRATYGISSPVTIPGGRAAALCAGLIDPPADSTAELVWIVDSYARLASLWLAERRGAPLLGNGRDELTGCLTYAALLERLNHELDRCRSADRELACCFVSLDNVAEDQRERLLGAVGRGLTGTVGDNDSVGRYGRTQFIVLLPGADIEDARRTAGLIHGSIAAIDPRGEVASFVGVAEWLPGTGPDRLLGDADRSLAMARNESRRRATA